MCVCVSRSAGAAAKSLQSCPTLCDPIDSSPPGFPVPGIPQARTLEWVAISFSKRNYRKKVKLLSHVQLFVTLWTISHQVPLSMGFPRQEHWSGLPCPLPEDVLDSGIEHASLLSPAFTDSLPLAPSGKPNWNVKQVLFS